MKCSARLDLKSFHAGFVMVLIVMDISFGSVETSNFPLVQLRESAVRLPCLETLLAEDVFHWLESWLGLYLPDLVERVVVDEEFDTEEVINCVLDVPNT